MNAEARVRPTRFSALAAWVAGLAGWRRSALALVLGLLAAGALPPIHALPLLVVSFTGFAWLVAASRSPWRAMICGWWFGFGHFIASIYWISAALTVDSEKFGWLVVPAVIGLSAGFALFIAVAAGAARLLPLGSAGIAVSLAVGWTGAEWLRGHILTGFPMNLIGTVWAPSIGMIQVTALIGVYGLSFVTVLAAAAPATLAGPHEEGRARRLRWLPLAGAFCVLLAIWVGGQIRLGLAPDLGADETRIRVVQPNVEQAKKWRPEERLAIVERQVALSRAPGFEAIDHVIWPEAALPFFLPEASANLRRRIASAAPPGGFLVTGAPRRDVTGGRTTALWNSLYMLASDGAIVATYDKHHLVPFGEYIPLRSVLGFLPKLTFGILDYSEGAGARTLRSGVMPPFSPLICYEAIFPGEVVAADERPAWLLNVTNDAWYGETAGPHQHFQTARLRAVEEGLPLVRAANTGISAVIDAHGRVLSRLEIGAAGVIDANLPRPLAAPPPYAVVGDVVLIALVALAILPFLGARASRSALRDAFGKQL